MSQEAVSRPIGHESSRVTFWKQLIIWIQLPIPQSLLIWDPYTIHQIGETTIAFEFGQKWIYIQIDQICVVIFEGLFQAFEGEVFFA